MSVSNKNVIILFGAFLLPVVAQFYKLGLGFDVLLYEPFDFAYVLFVGIVLLIANVAKPTAIRRHWSICVAFLLWILWFGVTFLAVGQIHLYTGGTL